MKKNQSEIKNAIGKINIQYRGSKINYMKHK